MEEDDDGGLNIDEFFEPEEPPQPLVASDGKIIFSYKSSFISNWNNMVIILAMYNSVTIPMAIFYGEDGHSMI